MALKVTELDFFQIRNNLKDHLKSLQAQGKFTDYDFDGSGMAMLLDLLAYNTHYNALNANMAINEVFLDTAERRANIVSHAKMLGYVPRSRTAAFTHLNLTVNVTSPVKPQSLTLDRGTEFTTIIGDKQYVFTALESTTISPVNGVYTFSNIKISQGKLRNFSYTVDSTDTSQYFEIPDINVDRDTIVVKVKENSSATAYDVYTLAKNFTTLNSKTKAFFLQEGIDGKYEIYFGDGIAGKKLNGGNVIQIEWLTTDGPIANGAQSFTLASTIQGYSTSNIDVLARSAGGTDREENDSIRFNAPLSYIAQNRVVTPDDYKAAILENYNNVESIAVWGGEKNDPPQYGKAYISIKPKSGEVLDDIEKTYIKDNILKSRNIVSITPEIIDPEYTYLKLQVFFKYNPSLTDKTAGELQSLVRSIVDTYNNTDLKQFDGVFRLSKLTRLIDTADASILSSNIRVFMQKRIVPDLGIAKRYQLNFSAPLYSSSSNERVLQSSAFTYNGITQYIHDNPQTIVNDSVHTDTDMSHKLEMYRVSNNIEYVTNNDMGYIITAQGLVVLNAFNPEAYEGQYMTFTAMPDTFDIAPKRNQLVKIDMDLVEITPQVDTIATGGTPGGIDYVLVTRHEEGS